MLRPPSQRRAPRPGRAPPLAARGSTQQAPAAPATRPPTRSFPRHGRRPRHLRPREAGRWRPPGCHADGGSPGPASRCAPPVPGPGNSPCRSRRSIHAHPLLRNRALVDIHPHHRFAGFNPHRGCGERVGDGEAGPIGEILHAYHHEAASPERVKGRAATARSPASTNRPGAGTGRPAVSRAGADLGPHIASAGRGSRLNVTSTRSLKRLRSPATVCPMPWSETSPMRSRPEAPRAWP